MKSISSSHYRSKINFVSGAPSDKFVKSISSKVSTISAVLVMGPIYKRNAVSALLHEALQSVVKRCLIEKTQKFVQKIVLA